MTITRRARLPRVWVTFTAGELIDTVTIDAGEPSVTTNWPPVSFSVTFPLAEFV